MLIDTEPLLGDPIVYLEADMRGDEDSSIFFFDGMDGPVLQLAGNGVDIAIRLDGDQLQEIVEKLADWGYTTSGKQD
jgi:hypothetical protein